MEFPVSLFSLDATSDPALAMSSAMLLLLAILGVLMVLSILLTACHPFRNVHSGSSGMAFVTIMAYLATVTALLIIGCSGLIYYRYTHPEAADPALAYVQGIAAHVRDGILHCA